MSSAAVDSISDLPNDPKSRAAQIARIQSYQNSLAGILIPVALKKETETSSSNVTKSISAHSLNTSSLEGAFAYAPAPIPSEKTQAPQDYPKVERTIASLILDMLPALKGLTDAIKLIGVSQETLQASLGDTWKLYQAASEAYAAAVDQANAERTKANHEAAHKIGLFGLIAGITECVFAIVTIATSGPLGMAAGAAMLADGLIKVARNSELLNNPDLINNPTFMEKQKDGLMGTLGLNGEKAQYIFQGLLILASLGASFATTTAAKGVGAILNTIGSTLSKVFGPAFAKIAQGVSEILANSFIQKTISFMIGLANKLILALEAAAKFINTGLSAAGNLASKGFSAVARGIEYAFSKLPNIVQSALIGAKNALVSALKTLSEFFSKAGNKVTELGNKVGDLSLVQTLAKPLSILNDLTSFTGLMIALGKHTDPNASAKDQTAGQAMVASLQNGFIGILAATPFAVERAKGHEVNELAQSILATALPMVLNSGMIAGKLGNGMANSNSIIEGITRNLNALQSAAGTFGTVGTVTSSGNNLFGSILTKDLSDIQNQASYQQSAYASKSSMLDSRITSIGNTNGDIQKILQNIAQSMTAFVDSLNQVIASSSKLLANS